MRETIRLGPQDDIAAAQEKMEAAQSRRVVLAIPRGNRALRSLVDLALLRRLADDLALDLVLVAGDSLVGERARSVGLRVSPSEGIARHVRPARRTAAPRKAVGGGPRPAAESGVGLHGYPHQPHSPSTLQRLMAVALVFGALLIVLGGMALLGPSATVLLDPEGSQSSAEAEIVASADVPGTEPVQGRVPARAVEIEVPGEDAAQPTGSQTVPDQYATGEVVFANKTTEPITIAKGTVVRTTDGVSTRFYTLLDVAVPGSYGAVARAPIMAFEPGSSGNVEALTIRAVDGDAALKVDVLNDQPIRGGTEKRVNVVQREDCDRLRATLMQKLQQEAYNQLVSQLGAGDWIPPDTLDVAIVDEVFDKQVDEQADMLHLTMRVKVTGLAVSGQATRALMASMLEAQAGSGRVVNDATLQVEQPVGQYDFDGQEIRFRARASAVLVRPVDARAVGTHLAGSDLRTAVEWLSSEYELRHPPEVRISPGWWPRLPWLAERINVELAGGL